MKRIYEITIGDRFGRLVVEGPREYRDRSGYKRAFHRCRCDCGAAVTVDPCDLRNGRTVSCNCKTRDMVIARNTTHGQSGTKLYGSWVSLRDRCGNPKNSRYGRYGGRGIKVCAAWIDDFAAFQAWADSNGYRPGLTIERKDNDGDYCPENCCWIPPGDQARNKSNNVKIEAFGIVKGLADWMKDARCVVRAKKTIISRIKMGWPAESAISTPSRTCSGNPTRPE